MYGLTANGTGSDFETGRAAGHFAVNGPMIDLVTESGSKLNIAIGTYGRRAASCTRADTVSLCGCDLICTDGAYGGCGTSRVAIRRVSGRGG